MLDDTTMPSKCINNKTNGCTKQSYQNVAGLTCLSCAIARFGVEETKKGDTYTQYRDPTDGEAVKDFEMTKQGRILILPFEIVSQLVPEEQKAAKKIQFDKKCEKRRGLSANSKARKNGDPDAPPAVGPAPRPPGAKVIGALCVNKPSGNRCVNGSMRNVSGLLCTPCVIEKFVTKLDAFDRPTHVFNPATNKEERLNYTRGLAVYPFGCYACFVPPENYKSKEEQFDGILEYQKARGVQQRKKRQKS